MRAAPTHAHMEKTQRLNAYMAVCVLISMPIPCILYVYVYDILRFCGRTFCYFPAYKLLRGIFRYRAPSKGHATANQPTNEI